MIKYLISHFILILLLTLPFVTFSQLECPDHVIYSQTQADIDSAAVSNPNFQTMAFEFNDVDAPITGVRLWAVSTDDEFTFCQLGTYYITLKFYKDNNGLPGEEVFSKVKQVGSANTGLTFFNEAPVFGFTLDMDEALSLSSGWFSATVFSTTCLFYPILGSDGNGTTAIKLADQEEWSTIFPSNFTGSFCFMSDPATSVNEEKISVSDLSLFPNPASDQISIKFSHDINYISIHNITGKKLSEYILSGKSIDLDISELRPGIYIIKIATSKGIVSKRILKE